MITEFLLAVVMNAPVFNYVNCVYFGYNSKHTVLFYEL